MVELDPKRRTELGQTARLWLLGLPCAGVGSYVVWRTDDVGSGIVAFLITLAVLGPFLFLYERRHKRRSRQR